MTIVTRENERLYLSAWEYNAAMIISELANIVVKNGGRFAPTKTAIISNRHLTESIREATNTIQSVTDAIKKHGETDDRISYLARAKKQLEEFQSVNNEPIAVTHTSYITFVLNDTYYYYQVDSNPFFEFYYQKTPIKNGKRSRDTCLTEDKKDWLFDCFFGFKASDDDISEAANTIYNMLINSPNTIIRRDSHKERVPNTYNDGYHMENVYAPERFAPIDF